MIYLLKTTGFDDVENPIIILKIGYTNDLRGDKRFNDYRNSGMDIRVLKQIPGGSIDVEHELQKKFSKYKLPNRSSIEWFIYENSIIEKFNEFSEEINILNFLGYNSMEEFEHVIQSQKEIETIKEKLDNSLAKMIDNLGSESKIVDFYKKLLYETTQQADRMKLICECNDKDLLMIVFDYLPILEYSKYYNILGPEKCKALKYRFPYLEKECNRYLNNDKLNIDSKILENFVVGSKYSLTNIKSTLSNIFDELGYDDTPKATILKTYFEVRPIKFTVKNSNGTSEKVNGFEILSIKGEE